MPKRETTVMIRNALRIAWLMIFGIFAVLLISPAYATNHDHGNPRLHNKLIHLSGTGHSANDEDYCTSIRTGAVSESQLR
jgi:hypothetical protein